MAAHSESATAQRKDAHLDLCATAEVEPEINSTLFDDLRLAHCAMPEIATDDIDLGMELFGRRLRYPLVITGMTGGTERAGEINRQLAALAEHFGVAFGVGSQRAMHEMPSRTASYQVRDAAPTTVLIGNIGLVQARGIGVDGVRRLMDAIGADAMAVHLNPGQELVQPEGDRDFRGGYRIIEALARALGTRLLVKETGCGIGPDVARRLVECGVSHIDVSGLGGTSWIRVEQLRARNAHAAIGQAFAGWGIPTAAAIAAVRRALGDSPTLIASGGLRTGLDLGKALALGADFAGVALPLFRALESSGPAGAHEAMEVLLGGLVRVFLLCGCRNVTELRARPRLITGELKEWLAMF
jgi:isopentenyl-diphosphate Delta-isomerase